MRLRPNNISQPNSADKAKPPQLVPRRSIRRDTAHNTTQPQTQNWVGLTHLFTQNASKRNLTKKSAIFFRQTKRTRKVSHPDRLFSPSGPATFVCDACNKTLTHITITLLLLLTITLLLHYYYTCNKTLTHITNEMQYQTQQLRSV